MAETKKTLEVCYSPALFELYDSSDSIVVVIDILRATSSICVALHRGAELIVPVAKVEDCLAYKQKGFLVAGERNGEMLPGFDFGNSPFSYLDNDLKGKSIALTTTNGTQAITIAKDAAQVVIGSFLNIDLLCSWLTIQNKNVICLCAGWKKKFNLEDTLFAGAVSRKLLATHIFTTDCDSAIGAIHLYDLAKNDLNAFLSKSSHRKRLSRLKIEKDIEYCLTPNTAPVIPKLDGDALKSLNFKIQSTNSSAIKPDLFILQRTSGNSPL